MRMLIFEIPVYQFSKKNHEEKWKDIKKNLIKKTEENELNTIFFKCYKYQFLWEYNHTIGFIRLYYNLKNEDIEFEIYKIYSKVFFNRINKMKFEKTRGPNLHINIKDKDNNRVKNEINLKLTYIKQSFFKSYNYIDTEAFNNICTFIDFSEIKNSVT